MNEILQKTFLGNTIQSYCWFIGILLLGLIFQKLLSKGLTKLLYRMVRKYAVGVAYDKLYVLLKKPLSYFILLVALYLSCEHVAFPKEWDLEPVHNFGILMIFERTYQMVLIISITWVLLRAVDFFGLILMYRASLTESKSDDQLVPFLKESIKVIVVILGIFIILGAVFKLNIASLIAGLGIGGLAIALAAKESLENLLGSFTIFLDKPFVIGDLIKVNGLEGHVEKIGFRSTRIRTLEKSYVTVPNKKMIDSELDNLSLRIQRRAKFNVGLTYETSPEQFKAIITEMQKVIDDHPHTLPGETRVRMHEFEASAISIMVLYFVDTLEFDVYLAVREEINYHIIDIVNKHGGSFAYPTTSVIMKK